MVTEKKRIAKMRVFGLTRVFHAERTNFLKIPQIPHARVLISRQTIYENTL